MRAIQIFGEISNEGRAGDNVGIQLEGMTTNKVKRGYMCGNLYDDPPREAKQITAQVTMCLEPIQYLSEYMNALHACTVHK